MGNVANVALRIFPIFYRNSYIIIEKHAAVGTRPFFPTLELSIILSLTISHPESYSLEEVMKRQLCWRGIQVGL